MDDCKEYTVKEKRIFFKRPGFNLETEIKTSTSTKCDLSARINFNGAGTLKKQLDTSPTKKSHLAVSDQTKHLKAAAVDHPIQMDEISVSAEVPTTSPEIKELQEQIVILKSLLSTKREQISTLRNVLKSNKDTAEQTLNNLKSEYESEKIAGSLVLLKLRNELRTMKEEAATFSNLRAMFAARCEGYAIQLDDMTRQREAAEEENKTLKRLLQMRKYD